MDTRTIWNKASNRSFLGLGEEEEQWQKPFFFAQLADTQLGFMESNPTNGKWLNPNSSWEKELQLCQEAVDTINRLKPRFVIVCGDLVHHMPELYPNTDPNIRTSEVAAFKNVFKGVHESIPLLCVCGNHDVGDKPNEDTIQRYKNDFGDDYYSFWVGGVFGVVLNSSIISDHSLAPQLYQNQLTWLEEILINATKKKPKTYFSFYASPSIYKGGRRGRKFRRKYMDQ